MTRFSINNRILACNNPPEFVVSGDNAIGLSEDTVFGFLEEGFEGSSLESLGENIYEKNGNDEDEDGDEENENVEDNGFWENQHQVLEATLYRTTSLESRIRQATKEALKEAQQSENVCGCRRPVDGCRNCLMKVVCSRLQNEGFNAAICKSKWRSSPDIPSGEHTFLDVLDNSNPKKEVRIIIELNLRAEFEMARASEEYNKLVKRLPEVFVGKIERLLSITKIICPAAKKCMKEKKMHMGPWRKLKYMQAKWLKTCERRSSKPIEQIVPNAYASDQTSSRPRASMLTLDLLENFPNLLRPTTLDLSENFPNLHRPTSVAVV